MTISLVTAKLFRLVEQAIHMLFAAGPKAVLLRQPQFFLQRADARLQRRDFNRVRRKLCQQSFDIRRIRTSHSSFESERLTDVNDFRPRLSRRPLGQHGRIEV